jgi:DNA polymerase elongation subunit (family B)
MQPIPLEQLLVVDIETVPRWKSFAELNENMQSLWIHKHQMLKIESETPAESYERRAGIYAEFGKVICISLGYFLNPSAAWKFKLKSFAGDEEEALLRDFIDSINKKKQAIFAGHNIKEFDIPYLCRRMLVHRIPIPESLNFSGRKPWEVAALDTLDLWRFGDYKNYTSLKLLAEVLNIPSPKDDIEGKDVAQVYWQQNDLPRIVSYCQRDVVTVARLLLRFRYESFELPDDSIFIVE